MKAQFDIALSAVKGDEAELWRRMAILTPKDFPDTKLWVQVRGLLEMSRLPIILPPLLPRLLHSSDRPSPAAPRICAYKSFREKRSVN